MIKSFVKIPLKNIDQECLIKLEVINKVNCQSKGLYANCLAEIYSLDNQKIISFPFEVENFNPKKNEEKQLIKKLKSIEFFSQIEQE
jgi:hypothetical protein